MVYYINLIWISLLAVPLCIYKPNRIKKAAYLVMTLGYMWFLATFREGIGFDYHNYLDIFEEIRATSLTGLFSLQYEWGFSLLTKAMSVVIGQNPVVIYGLYSAMTLIPIGIFVYRHCKDAWFSVWLYVTITFFYTSMNFVRQSIACSVVLLGYSFLRDKKMLRFFVVVLLAASLHKSALIMIPIYFLCHIKLNKVWGWICGIGTLVAYLLSDVFLDIATNYVFTSYKDSIYVQPFSPVFLLIPFCIFGGCLAMWPVWRKRYSEADMLLNLMMFSAIIWLFITKHFIIERFSMHIYIFAIIALPQAISCLQSPQADYDRLTELEAKSAGKKKSAMTKEESNELRKLSNKINDHHKYYASAVAAAILLTLIYNEFGQQVNGFHNVFPYHSVIERLDTPGDPIVNGKPVPQAHIYE